MQLFQSKIAKKYPTPDAGKLMLDISHSGRSGYSISYLSEVAAPLYAMYRHTR